MDIDDKRKKELRMNYLQEQEDRKIEDGVYKIQNLVNGKIFVGGTRDINNLAGIKFQLEMGGFLNKDVQKDWIEYGEDKFAIEVLEKFEQVDNIRLNAKKRVELERKWKKTLDAYGEKGYHKKFTPRSKRG